MFSKLIGWLTGAPVEQVGEYFRHRQELRHKLSMAKLEGKQKFEEAKWAARAARQAHFASWEMSYVAQQATSKKDEVVLAVVLTPYVGAFIPGVQDHVLTGFDYLNRMPLWAVGMTVAICLAIYGIRHKAADKISAPGLSGKDNSKK